MKDEVIAELREIRHQISQEFDHDPRKYIAYLQQQENKYAAPIELYKNLTPLSVWLSPSGDWEYSPHYPLATSSPEVRRI